MPPPATKTLSPAELAKLEHAFATDPASDAYKPLAEAYLGMGRFMEAMVVCKKGVKAHPNLADPRVLLARVYAEQGKDKKALEELTGALQVAPADKLALRLAGSLQMKSGEADAGKANLLKAYEADPSDTETQALLTQWKVEVPKPAAPEPPKPPPAPAPSVRPAAAPARAENGASAHVQAPVVHAPAQAEPPRPAKRVNGAEAHQVPARAPQPARPAARPVARRQIEDDDEDVAEASDPSFRRGAPSKKRSQFLLMLIAVPVALGAYWGYGRYQATRNREIKKALSEATDQLKSDSYDSYKKACELADKVLELDSDHVGAHGYLAYAYTIRWGEHGGGDEARKRAEEHLEAAREGQGKDVSSHFYAADALFKAYSGKGAEALKELEGHVKSFDAEGKKSSLMYLTLGLIQMHQGDLEHAKESLDAAQVLAPDDPRVYSALGTLHRRKGQNAEAWAKFDFALRYQREHPESNLGKALLILEQDEPDKGYVGAARMLKRLIESEPPPSPRQLATAHLARALLVSRVSNDLPLYTNAEFRKELSEGTGVGTDKDKNKAEVNKAEETGFALDGKNPELLLIKGKRLLYEESFDAAAAEIRKAIGIDSSRAHYHVELARALMKKQGGEKEAEDSLRKALTMLPESPKLLTMLGQVLQRQNKLDEALAQFERAVKDPAAKNPEARYALGRLYRDHKKDNARAVAAFEKAAQEFVGQRTSVAQAYDEAAITYEAMGNKDKARELYEKSMGADAQFDPVLCHYAKFLSGSPADRSKVKILAQEYLKLAPKGACAEEMGRMAR